MRVGFVGAEREFGRGCCLADFFFLGTLVKEGDRIAQLVLERVRCLVSRTCSENGMLLIGMILDLYS